MHLLRLIFAGLGRAFTKQSRRNPSFTKNGPGRRHRQGGAKPR